MNVLDIESLTEALITCHNNPRYRINVLFKSRASLEEVTKSFKQSLREDGIPGVDRMHFGINQNTRLQFKNGSVIDLLMYRDRPDIYTCHDLLFEAELGENFEYENRIAISQRLIKYHGESIDVPKPFDWTEVESNEVDNFLSSLKVGV